MHAVEQLQTSKIENQVRAERRKAAQQSLAAFGKLYFSEHLSRPPSKMHKELYELLQDLPPGGRLAVAGPRGSAKSTLVSLIYLLWFICYKKAKFIVLVSDTEEKAADFLGHVKDELVENDRLVADFPEVCEQGGRYPRWPRWRRNEIITANKVKVTSLGYGQNIRGKRHRQDRPELILLDDVEGRENTATAEGRFKLDEWFHKAILKSGTRDTRVVVVGTIQHYDALLSKLTDPTKNPMWTGRIYRSVMAWASRQDLWESWVAILRRMDEYDGATGPAAAKAYFEAHRQAMLEGTDVLWPECEDYHTLMLMREGEGPAAFDSEKQNEPVNPADCYFAEEDFRFWDETWPNEQALIASLESNAQFFGACDPSLGKLGKHADDSAIITLVKDAKSGNLYVLDADIARRKPDKIIDDVLAYQRIRKYARFALETNQFQSFLKDELERRSKAQSLYLRVEGINHTTDKMGRIQSLQPLVRSGALQFSRRHRVLLEQLRLFPKASHDDGPDALQMAVHLARVVGGGPTKEEWEECIRLNREHWRRHRTDWDSLLGVSGSARDWAWLL